MENISARIDSVLKVLEMLDSQPAGLTSSMKDQILNLHLEFRFLKLFSMFVVKGVERARDDLKLDSIMINLEALLMEKDQSLDEDWETLVAYLLEEVESLKPMIKETCNNLWDCSMEPNSGASEEIIEFMDLILWNLRDFVNWKDDTRVSVKDQIRVLQEKLCFIGNLVNFSAKRCSDQKKLEEFWGFIQGVMNNTACLSVLYWICGKDENPAAKLDDMLADLLRKLKPYNSNVIEMYFGVLLTSKSSQYAKFMISEIVMNLCDLLLEDLVTPIKDHFEVLREGLIFLITFLMMPPENPQVEAGNVLLTQIDDIISEVISYICAFYMDGMELHISSQGEICLPGLLDLIDKVRAEIEKVRAEIGEIYVHIPKFSGSNFPLPNGIVFIDYFLGNLKDMMKSQASSIPFAEEKVLTIQEELLPLRDFLKDIIELKNEHQEVENLWKQIINVAYHTEYVVNSCLLVENPIWYDMINLSKVIEEIEVIKIEIQKISDLEMYKVRKHDVADNSSPVIPRQANTSRIEEVVVGFEDEMETIIDRLTRGSRQLDIISIVGMPGQGKTTLARKVYNDPSVKYHFNRCAWCHVSQVYQTKELLLDILSDLTGLDVRTSDPKASEEELAEWLWKSLKRRKFLIVFDDIWDIGAWDEIKISLPDDDIGSRILFTSRIHNLVLQAKPNSNPHSLRPLDDEESWELLQKRLFDNNGCPSELLEIGMKIAKNCKGLPLAVVLVAGVLARKDNNLDYWKEIKESMGSHIASEGCKDMLELSYKHLPDCLRPCFLYFGAFQEAKIIRVGKLMKLWIAEGFVPRNEAKSLDDTAGEYLVNLIDRSLVTVATRSSKGEIKACRVHDLLHDFSLAKAREERFLHWIHGIDVPNQSSNPKIYEQYRLCIGSKWKQFINSRPAGTCVHSLVVSGIHVEWCKNSEVTSFFLGFKFLNVLDMECVYIDEFFPEEIILMIHLRYLAVWCCTNYLPSSVADLWNLETLIVKGARMYSIPLPDTIWSMQSLRHIDIPTMSFRDYKNDNSCQLHNVDSFSTPTLTCGRDTEELLRRLPRLRKLKCNFLEMQLDSNDPIHFPVLSSLSQLESLIVYNCGDMLYGEDYDQFPSFSFPNTLRKLTLEVFCLTGSAMSIIGQLPNLEVLKLRQAAFLEQRWDIEDGEFLNLKFLELSKVQIKQWNVCSEPFPCLERLILKNCDSLEEIPSSFRNILTLERMYVYCCLKASSSAKRIVEEERDLGNDCFQLYIIEN